MIIRNGLVALPGEGDFRRASIRARGERIAEIAESLEPLPGEEAIDASGLLVLPGAIDPHVHFSWPGRLEIGLGQFSTTSYGPNKSSPPFSVGTAAILLVARLACPCTRGRLPAHMATITQPAPAAISPLVDRRFVTDSSPALIFHPSHR